MILVLSPHLDDAAFSCGGLLASLPQDRVLVVTCFTRSVPNPRGFALACQQDKGLADEVDYMALRRAEDAEAMGLLDVNYRWWELAEAPHRGYHSAADLFAGMHDDDRGTTEELIERTAQLIDQAKVDTLLYPRGAGRHVDHLHVVAAVETLIDRLPTIRFVQYFDQPYTNKHPDDYPETQQAELVDEHALLYGALTYCRMQPDVEHLDRKWAACNAYRTQLPFQFGDTVAMRQLLGPEEYFCVR